MKIIFKDIKTGEILGVGENEDDDRKISEVIVVVFKIDMSKVTPINELVGDDSEDTLLLKEMLNKAKTFISGYRWCEKIMEVYYGIGVGGIVAIFLMHILPKEESVDEYIWVVVGDIPPLYITTEDSPNPACGLDSYIGALEEWIKAVKSGRAVEKLAPIDLDPTIENALKLKRKTEFIDREILSNYSDDLSA